MGKIYNDITKLIGNTPLVRVQKLLKNNDVDLLLKLESFNPFSSVKDRIGLAMIEDAERQGHLKDGMVIVEATSGNTGIGLAFVAAVKGYEVILTMPDSMTLERRNMLKSLGVKLELTPGAKGMNGAIDLARKIAEDLPNAWTPKQFDNAANPQVHVETTGPEIWSDTDGMVDIFVAGVGTGGTVTGTGKYLKSKNSAIQVVAVEPEASAVLSGGEPGPHIIQGIGAGFIPNNYQSEYIDEVIQVSNQDAISTTRNLVKNEAIFAGVSSGAIAHAALQIASRPENKGKTIVAMVCDFGERYLSNPVYSELD
ncbi:MAG: cysteine synthase A [Candidatus Cloacimonetes bacterium]|nr:cysteine synthase A [Candidatus Cloacimonadota bacterium]